ncbi:Quinonprotein alcohol dehydrogenase-like superfamily [Phaffia rhodozyma]|uniref:Quinonprotein alcohol dehydrogenase-like superfamily n=1 Tax=Phaffia rhodozyma TaxID=264483 RepID=A0A0F7SQC1_PHARH|nr:Quinonprotein alcohol dehydrogenase-like superfamily [Phaffia rhodozyma]
MSTSPENSTILYKILTEKEFDALYETAPIKGDYWLGTSLDLNDKFIHTSSSHQLEGTLDRFFKDVELIHLLAIPRSNERIEKTLKFDEAGNGEKYGHLYEGLDLVAEVSKRSRPHWRERAKGTEFIGVAGSDVMPATYSIRFHASGFWLCLLLVLSIFLVISPVLSSSLPFPKSSSLPSPPPSSSPWSSPDSSLLAPYTPFSPHLRSSDIHVSPLVLVSTINGDLHALNRVTGEKLWTVQGEGSMVGSERPRRRRSKYQRNPEQVESNERFLVDPRKGEIWLGSLDQSASDEKDRGWRFKKMGVTVPDLVHASFHSLPVHFRQDPNPSRVFSGKIDTSLIAINLMTGKVVKFGDEAGSAATYLGEHSLVGSLEGQSEERDRLMDLLDELEGEEEEKGDVGELLYLTRTDYTLRIHHPPTPDSVTTLKYSTYSPPPSSLDPLLSSAIWGHGRTADGLYAMFAAGTQGALQAEKDGGVVLGFREVDQKKTAGAGTGGGLEGVWAVNMDSLPIAFYDILSITNIDAPPFILPQPIPSLSTLFSTPHGPPSRLPQILFIGQTTSHNTSSSLFALSRDNHPLIGYFQPLSSSARTSELEGYHVLDGVDLIDEELSLRMPSSSSSTEKGVKEGWKEKQERIGIEGPPEWAQSNGRDLGGGGAEDLVQVVETPMKN